MHLVLKDYKEFNDWTTIGEYLSSSSSHYLKTMSYPPEDFPEKQKQRIIVLGPNKQTGYFHLPATASDAMLFHMCRLIAKEHYSSEKEPDLADFLQVFADRLIGHFELQDVANDLVQRISALFEADGAAILIFNRDKTALRFISCYSNSPGVVERLTNLEVAVDKGVAGWVVANQRPILVEQNNPNISINVDVDNITNYSTKELIGAPIILGDELIGVLEVVSNSDGSFSDWDLPTLSVAATVAAIFVEKANMSREKENYERVAGKAEIANSVLHNIGNVLNSVNVSCSLMQSKLEKSKIAQFDMVTNLLEQHEDNLSHFFNEDPKGKLLLPFLVKLGSEFRKEHESLKVEVEKIVNRSNAMRDIIKTQQTIAKLGNSEIQDLLQLLEEAVSIQQDLIQEKRVYVERDYKSAKPIQVDKAKLVHVFVNLIKNAIEAMDQKDAKVLRLETGELSDGSQFCDVIDNGMGISQEVRSNLFTHGFTTKHNGHGFGLSSCLKAMEEMGGQIEVHSEGPGMGSQFRLSFPAIESMGGK